MCSFFRFSSSRTISVVLYSYVGRRQDPGLRQLRQDRGGPADSSRDRRRSARALPRAGIPGHHARGCCRAGRSQRGDDLLHCRQQRDLLSSSSTVASPATTKRTCPRPRVGRADPERADPRRSYAHAEWVAASCNASSIERMLRSAAHIAPDAAAQLATGARQRHAGMRELAQHLHDLGAPADLSPDEAADRIDVLTDPRPTAHHGPPPVDAAAIRRSLTELLVASLLPPGERLRA